MQGDDSKEGRDSKRLSRAELLEMLIEQSKEVESLKKEVAKLQKQLDDRTIQLQQTGSKLQIRQHPNTSKVSSVWSMKRM